MVSVDIIPTMRNLHFHALAGSGCCKQAPFDATSNFCCLIMTLSGYCPLLLAILRVNFLLGYWPNQSLMLVEHVFPYTRTPGGPMCRLR